MNELKPCPFCGGEAHTYRNHLWHVGCERALNGCVTMSVFVTEAEAIDAWNTRAERTCRDEDGWCSECHKFLMNSGYAYCPHCGAKVVSAIDVRPVNAIVGHKEG